MPVRLKLLERIQQRKSQLMQMPQVKVRPSLKAKAKPDSRKSLTSLKTAE